MASKCKIAKNARQEHLIEQYREKRQELKAIWLDTSRSPEEREGSDHRKENQVQKDRQGEKERHHHQRLRAR